MNESNLSCEPSLSEPPQEAPSLVIIVLFAMPATAIILLTIVGNLLVLLMKARVGRRNTTLLVWNLGLADFLVGIIVLPMGVVNHLGRRWIFGRLMCRIWVCCDIIFCTSSIITICVISADRYLAVTRPLRYKSLVTKSRVIVVILLIWIFSSSILLATVRWEQSAWCTTDNDESVCFAGNEIRHLAHSVVFAFFMPAAVTLTLYWRIYKLARNRQRALDRGFLMILGQNMNFLTNTIGEQTRLRVHFGGTTDGMVEHQRRVLRTHERIAKTLGVVSCSFLFCWLPFFGLYLTNNQCQGCVPPLAIDTASWLGYCNSMINPIIYSFTVKEFKRSAVRLIVPIWRFTNRCLYCIPSPPEHISSHLSRKGGRSRLNKQQHRRSGNELSGGPSRIRIANAASSSNKRGSRRHTEPAVFRIVDDEEEEDGEEEQSDEEESVENEEAGDDEHVIANGNASARLYFLTQEADV